MALAERWSHELSLNDDDQLRAKIDLCRALEANDEGSLDAAADISRAVCQRADANGWTTIRGLARLHLANCQLLRGTTDASLEMVKSGILDLESADDPDAIETLASGLLLLGNHARRNGRFAEAERSLRRATELLRTTGNRSREIRASLELARCLWQDDREPESRHQIALGLRTAERIQSRAALAEVHHARGELERHKGRLRRALADYRKASRLWASVSTLNRFINELNEALSLLGLGNTAEAAPMLERLEEESRTLGIQAARPLFEVAAAFCHVSRHAFEAASRRLDAVDEVNWASTIAAPDIQWVAMLGVDKAASAGHETLTERFREISGDAS
jgi:tetratricopeptide (TPR) repeat protein